MLNLRFLNSFTELNVKRLRLACQMDHRCDNFHIFIPSDSSHCRSSCVTHSHFHWMKLIIWDSHGVSRYELNKKCHFECRRIHIVKLSNNTASNFVCRIEYESIVTIICYGWLPIAVNCLGIGKSILIDRCERLGGVGLLSCRLSESR